MKRLRVFLSHEELDEDNVERPAITACESSDSIWKSGIKQMCPIVVCIF